MRHAIKFVLMGMFIVIMTCGCTARRAQKTGVLSDYSKLKPQSDVSYRYRAPGNPLKNYSKFIIEPVAVYLHAGSKEKGKISKQDLTDLKNYMHDALVNASTLDCKSVRRDMQVLGVRPRRHVNNFTASALVNSVLDVLPRISPV